MRTESIIFLYKADLHIVKIALLVLLFYIITQLRIKGITICVGFNKWKDNLGGVTTFLKTPGQHRHEGGFKFSQSNGVWSPWLITEVMGYFWA